MRVARAVQPLAYLLAPVLLLQGLALRRRIPRLAEAADPAGTAAAALPVIRLAVFGDSTAAGVGATSHEDALAGQLGAALAGQTGRAVSWRAIARSGVTSRTARELVPGLVQGHWRPDVVVLAIGVNDLKNLRRLRDWDRDVAALLAAIEDAVGPVPVIVCGMAQVSRFPALRQPLRAVMAVRAKTMDDTLRRVGQERHVPVGPAIIDAEFFALDGFHPSSAGYRAWAGELVGPVARVLLCHE
jgi:lysophospholipase L1-like esterase